MAATGALVSANADSESAKPKPVSVIVLIEVRPPGSSLSLVRTITHYPTLFHGLRHWQGGRLSGFRIMIFDGRIHGIVSESFIKVISKVYVFSIGGCSSADRSLVAYPR